jgi:hypothetical protein
MATVQRLMASGMQAMNASHLGQTSVSSIAAAGASAGNATAITSSFTYVTTAPSNTGVILKNAGGQPETVIYNGGANTLKVYPATSEKINNGTATTGALSVPTLKAAILVGNEGAWIGIVSA